MGGLSLTTSQTAFFKEVLILYVDGHSICNGIKGNCHDHVIMIYAFLCIFLFFNKFSSKSLFHDHVIMTIAFHA